MMAMKNFPSFKYLKESLKADVYMNLWRILPRHKVHAYFTIKALTCMKNMRALGLSDVKQIQLLKQILPAIPKPYRYGFLRTCQCVSIFYENGFKV